MVVCLYISAAPKAMPSILFCCPTTSEVDVGGMAVGGEPSYQYSITFCCRVTGGSKGAVWQSGVMEVQMKQRYVVEFFHVEKNSTH